MQQDINIKEKLKFSPTDPGIYMMKNEKGTIIYVGKAKHLKNRLTSYFTGFDQLTPKTRALVREIRDFDVMITKTEVEALLLERTLIKHHQPPFNILLRDDKEYPLLKFTVQDPWPRIFIVRKRKDDGARYFGPFVSAGYLRTMLDAAYKVFPLIRCSTYEFEHAKRPCNYYHMKLCLGPCTLPVDRDGYISMVEDAVDFIQGKNKVLEASLHQKMQFAAQKEDYDKASQYRDQIRALNALKEKQAVIIANLSDTDVIGIKQNPDFAAVIVMIVREGILMGQESYFFDHPELTNCDSLISFLLQYYDGRNLPQETLMPDIYDNVEPVDNLFTAINQIGHGKTTWSSPKRGVKKDLMDMVHKNVEHTFEEEYRKRTKDLSQLQLLQEFLKLPKLPVRMECIDISQFQGTAVVASDVCFVQGKPAKHLYRTYAIKQELGFGGDDFASIREVVERRINRGLKEDDLPDLLVIDGGKPQLNAALEVLHNYPHLNLPILGLAKSRVDSSGDDKKFEKDVGHSQERVFLPNFDTAIPLAVGSAPFRLLTQIRDEAHRFAITYHRKKRKKVLQSSQLEEIPGVGPKMRKKLLQHFLSVDGVRKASYEQLRAIPGIKSDLACTIMAYFKDLPKDRPVVDSQ